MLPLADKVAARLIDEAWDGHIVRELCPQGGVSAATLTDPQSRTDLGLPVPQP